MSSSTIVTFVGAKGGVGTSTIAALHAIQLARLGRTVRLSANDAVDDLAAIVGVPCPGPDETARVLPGLTLGEERCTDTDAINVIDAGTDCFSGHDGSAVYLVIRNDYQSLRRALNAPRTTTGLVLVTEAQRSLNRRDVEDVLAQTIVAELRLDPAIARAVDAGLLSTARHLRVDLSLGVATAYTG
ncbi:MAG: hypothetical protein LC790_03430 [Actinobacteria bacterium]|nr:hypothetical protein [Actinomycetota bacterium]